MSIPVRLQFYDVDGNFIDERSCFTVSYTDNPNNLNLISKNLSSISIDEHKKYVDSRVRYVVPSNIEDYMFDLENPTVILPNKFKRK